MEQKYYVMGSTHIDLAWLKDEAEMEEIFDILIIRLLDAMENDESFTYILEQAYLFRSLEKRRPDLIERLKKYIKEGRIEFGGGWASSLETNTVDGESIIRNQLLGLKWIKDYFDVGIKSGWLIDTFGLNAQMPQIHKQFGVKDLMANRFGANQYHDVFIAHGLDGSEILVAGRDVYAPYVKYENIYFDHVRQWSDIDRLFEKADSAEDNGPIAVMPYTENEEVISLRPIYHVKKRSKDNEAWGFSVPSEFFKALERSQKKFPIMNGDLNPEFSGKFSQRMHLRLRNRKLENLLLEAEKWSVLNGVKGWKEEAEEAWWQMAYIHSHDVITGFHITQVYHNAMLKFDRIEKASQKILDRAVGRSNKDNICAGSNQDGKCMVKIYNGLPFDREDIACLPSDLCNAHKVVFENSEVPFEYTDGRLRVLTDLPACGFKTLTVVCGDKSEGADKKQTNSATIENEYILLKCDDKKGIKQLIWKPTGKVLMEDAEDFLIVQQDLGNFQIEDIKSTQVPAGAGTIKLYSHENSEVSSRLTLSGVFPSLYWTDSDRPLEWEAEFSLVKGKPILNLKLVVRWHGEKSRIRLNLATSIDTSEGIFEIPFGVVKRKPYGTRGNSRGEWPLNRFVAIEDGKHGLALINTGVIGAEVLGGTIQTTLLRTPSYNPYFKDVVCDEFSSQHGELTFNFAIAPYDGSWEDSKIAQLAQEVNCPAVSAKIAYDENELKEFSNLKLKPENLVLSTIKAPEDGSDDIIIRFYETMGRSVLAEFEMDNAENGWVSDMTEERLEALSFKNSTAQINVKPFEIKTIRIKRR